MEIELPEFAPDTRQHIKEKHTAEEQLRRGNISDAARDKINILVNLTDWLRQHKRTVDTARPEQEAVELAAWYGEQDSLYHKKHTVFKTLLDVVADGCDPETAKQVRKMRDQLDREWDGYSDGERKTNEGIAEEKLVRPEELKEACVFCSDRTQLVLRMLFDTGVRVGELAGMTVEDVSEGCREWPDKEFVAEVQVKRKQNRQGVIEDTIKNYMERRVGLRPVTYDMLQEYIASNDLSGGDRLFAVTNTSIGNWVRDAFHDVGLRTGDGVENITTHNFRHTMATYVFNIGGWERRELRRYGGWKPGGAINRYLQFVNYELFDGIEDVLEQKL